MKIDIRKRSIGLNFLEGNKVEIWLWAPNANNVLLFIPEKELEIPLLKQNFGYWYALSSHISEGDQYSFKIWQSGETEDDLSAAKPITRADPASIYQKDGISGMSTALNLKSFHWTDTDWKGVSLEDYIIYELHTGTFTPDGDFKSIENKLDYLVDLGINAIEIMPVAQFPGNRNWGYDGVYPFAVQNTYGGPKELQHLVNLCHEKGIAVILDVVYNHLGPEGNYFSDFGAYFTDKYHTPWGSAINLDDEKCDPVRQYYIENVLMWFRDFHIDALRLDAVHAIKDGSAKHILREIKENVNLLSETVGRDFNLIVELDLNDNKYINPIEQGGYGMDAQWIDEFHHALRVTAGQAKYGYYSDFDGIEHLGKALTDAYVYDGQFSTHREKCFGTKAKDNPGKQFIVFSQNHDQVGNRMLGERTSQLVSFEMLKLMAATVFVSPYLPLIFMGEEYAEENPFMFFISHIDEELVGLVREGRKREFAAFHNGEEVPDPQSEETFNHSKLNWQSQIQGKHQIMHAFYKAIIKLRKSSPALAHLDRQQLKVDVYRDQNCLTMIRWHQKQKVLCALNFSKQQQVLPVSNGLDYNLVLNSAANQWGGNDNNDVDFTDNKLTIFPESILIFSSQNV
ncbi:malto-oligosyltrehalose trehalohydrolase [Pedobacter sp. MC2016-05]|uniref:malto-oligosyltrehalose trehalohydrolase n=1 Tax=Pedobacter sp. MC2016-05 TaxID=2994474 RepID=UPI002245D439|nr:malto-oligosyltrehalose trehalohydrolase [Pedobacter sp. MC2016-05]MCX2475022.1 malto-oligosyltrehalose trehalohydrolase [Pedobacter sp. MC2016-05]